MVLKYCGVSKSTYYYQPTGGKSGRKSYAAISTIDGKKVSKEDVLVDINKLFEGPFVDYGYFKTYIHLRDRLGYKISKHTVYKIMKDNGLLRKKNPTSSKKDKKNWVKDLIPKPLGPFSFLEFDIKYVYVSGKKKNMQVLTVLCVDSRWNLGQYMAYNIKKEDVLRLFKQIFKTYKIPEQVIVRNDNGSQFVATEVRKYFESKYVTQEFTKPATPVQNAHIESYHSIMESVICQRFEFQDLKNAKETMKDFREFYNLERIHGGVGFKSPYEYLLQKGIDMKSIPVFEV